MTQRPEGIGEEGPRFFGKMTASVSHEIKNVLAIINENAGLLDDYSRMADQGMALESERLRRVSGNIQAQVRRADTIVRNLSRFAHSVDEGDKQLPLDEVVELVLALAARFAANRGVTLERVAAEDGACTLHTSPFILELLLWRCLDYAMSTVDDDKAIRVIQEPCAGGCRVIFNGMRPARGGNFPGPLEQELLEVLTASLALDDRRGTVILTLRA